MTHKFSLEALPSVRVQRILRSGSGVQEPGLSRLCGLSRSQRNSEGYLPSEPNAEISRWNCQRVGRGYNLIAQAIFSH